MFFHKFFKMLNYRGLVYIFQGCHIKITLPARLKDLDDLDGHIIQDGHPRNDGDSESFAYKSGNRQFFVKGIVALREAAAGLIESVDDMP